MNNYIEVTQCGFNDEGKISSFVFKVKNSTLSQVFISTQDNWNLDSDSHSKYYIYKAGDTVSAANWTIDTTAGTYSLNEGYTIYYDEDSTQKTATFVPTIDDLTLMTTKVTVTASAATAAAIANSSCSDDCTEPTFPVYTLATLREEALKLYNYECCEFPRYFVDAILRIKAIDLCIKANNLVRACKWWKMFVGQKVVIKKKGCCCGR